MAHRRLEPTGRPEPPSAAAICTLRVHRTDGLEVELVGPMAFVTATAERLLTGLGVLPPPPA